MLIPLTQGFAAVVDDADYWILSKYKWSVSRSTCSWYACRYVWENGRSKKIYMHREIMNAPPGQEVHHGRLGTLFNRRMNLEVCSRSENLAKRRHIKCVQYGLT